MVRIISMPQTNCPCEITGSECFLRKLFSRNKLWINTLNFTTHPLDFFLSLFFFGKLEFTVERLLCFFFVPLIFFFSGGKNGIYRRKTSFLFLFFPSFFSPPKKNLLPKRLVSSLPLFPFLFPSNSFGVTFGRYLDKRISKEGFKTF